MKFTPSDLSLSPLSTPNGNREIVARFDGGRLSSNGGLLVLREIDRDLALSQTLANCLTDARDPKRVHHSYRDMIAARLMAIAAGYEDCNDLDHLREDPAFKMAIGRAPETGIGLPSQPTLSRLENLSALQEWSWRALARMGLALIDTFCRSYAAAPKAITLDIDDTPDVTHGAQQLNLFNSFVGEYCYRPIHVYEADSGKPVTCLLFPGKRPDGAMVARIIRHLVQRIARHWPDVNMTVRGDSHYASHKAMDWLEERGDLYIFGLSTNKVLSKLAQPWCDAAATERALVGEDRTRTFHRTSYQAKSWSKQRSVVARVEATKREDLSDRAIDVRFVVSNIPNVGDQALYEEHYCARGQAENFIKDHKRYTASDRTSCHKWQANQFRLFLHTAAYWFLHQLRERLAETSPLKRGTFETLRSQLIKVAVRVTELASRIKLSFPSGCPRQGDLKQLCQAAVSSP